MSAIPIADLHCDLLAYLNSNENHTPYDPQVRCSIPQMHAGRVRFQVLAIFAQTRKGSSQHGLDQAEIFKVMAHQHPNELETIQTPEKFAKILETQKTGIVAAVENASAFWEEDEAMQEGQNRFLQLFGKVGRPLYVSLTWNGENRFGGGAETQVGLKEDGKRLLEFLQGKQIAVDLSHASDTLAHDIIETIMVNSLDIPVIASHCNTRSVQGSPRNLPDEILQEIFRRRGLVGLNFIRAFVGEEGLEALSRHLETIFRLGGENHVCFGADFFYDGDAPKVTLGRTEEGFFFPELESSDCYETILSHWQSNLDLSDQVISKLAYRNVSDYISRVWASEEALSAPPMVQL